MKPDLTVPDFMYREQEFVKALRGVVRQNIERHGGDVAGGTYPASRWNSWTSNQ